MTDDLPKIDTYSTLEFQGIVADVPIYDRKTGKLEFVARALGRPTLQFIAYEEVGRAFKSILHKGCMVQLQATPRPKVIELGGLKCRVLEWEAKRMTVLGTNKVNLGAFSDLRILDGLMPLDGDYEDVGFIEPYSFAKYQARIKAADEALQRLKEEEEEGNET